MKRCFVPPGLNRVKLIPLALSLAILLSTTLQAAILYESAAPGTVGAGGPYASVRYDQWFGIRFQLTQAATATKIGGHFVGGLPGGAAFFGALVKLTSPDDHPDTEPFVTFDNDKVKIYDWQGTDILAKVTMTAPYPDADIRAELSGGGLLLEPGHYGLVFGTPSSASLVGMVTTGSDIGTISGFAWIAWSELNPGSPYPDAWYDGYRPANTRFVVEGSYLAAPGAPTNLSAKAIASSAVIVGWKGHANKATGFLIERKAGKCSSADPWMQIPGGTVNAESYTDSGLTPDSSYAYRVRSYDPSGNSPYSTCVSATTAPPGTPNAPDRLKALAKSQHRIELTWRDNSADESEFRLFRKVDPGPWTLLSVIAANSVKYIDLNAEGNDETTTYRYYLQACGNSGCSPPTNVAAVPFAPTILGTAPSAGRIDLAWTDNSSFESGFQVFRRNGGCASANPWLLRKTVGANVSQCSNKGLLPGASHAYRVRSFKRSPALPHAYGYSVFSTCSEAATP